MKSLIVTADDFGLASEVNRAVERAHTEGILSAASLMVSGPAAAEAVAIAKRLPSLRVGLHLVLVDGAPTLAPREIPELVGPDGRLRRDLARVGAAIFLHREARRQAAREIEAQFAAFAATGLALDHLNGHHHFHVHPSIGALAVEIGWRYGLSGVRVPSEPREVLRAIEPAQRIGRDWLLGPWARGLERTARRRGMSVPHRVFGVAWSGAMTERRVASLICRLPGGISELYLHPAAADDFAGATPGYAYRAELEALVSPAVRRAVGSARARLGGFADFTAS